MKFYTISCGCQSIPLMKLEILRRTYVTSVDLSATSIEKNPAKLMAIEKELVQKASKLTKLHETSHSKRITANRSDSRRKRS